MTDLARYQTVPYVDGGRSRDGADCYGIGWLYNMDRGVALPRFGAITSAATRPFLKAVAEGRSTWREIGQGDEVPGDAVLLRRHLSALPLHLGWVVDDGRVMSTTRATGVTFTELGDLTERLCGIYRYDIARAEA